MYSIERKLQKRLPTRGDGHQTRWWEDLANKGPRDPQRIELKRLQIVLRGLLPPEKAIAAGPLQTLILAYNKLVFYFTAVHAMSEEYHLLLLDSDRTAAAAEEEPTVLWEMSSSFTHRGSSSRKLSS
jgi:hypothetical protein